MAILKSIGSLAARGGNRPYRPDPGNLRYYEGAERGEIERLYQPSPYASDPSLGYSPNVMQGLTSEGRDLTRGARVGTRQRISDAYRRAGSYGRDSAQRERAGERADLNALTNMALINRANIIRNADVKRADFSRRLRAIQGAYRFGTGTYNEAQKTRYAQDLRAYEGIGGSLDAAISGGIEGWGTRRRLPTPGGGGVIA